VLGLINQRSQISKRTDVVGDSGVSVGRATGVTGQHEAVPYQRMQFLGTNKDESRLNSVLMHRTIGLRD